MRIVIRFGIKIDRVVAGETCHLSNIVQEFVYNSQSYPAHRQTNNGENITSLAEVIKQVSLVAAVV